MPEKISVMILGECNVGKTSYVVKLCNDIFFDDYASTIGYDFHYTFLNIDQKSYGIEIYDTSGNEIFNNILLPIYQKVDCYIIMYDVSNIDTLKESIKWYNKIKNNNTKPKKILLLGNKIDRNISTKKESNLSVKTNENIVNNEKDDSLEIAMAYAKSMEILYDQISIINDENIIESFVNFIKKVKKSSVTCTMM